MAETGEVVWAWFEDGTCFMSTEEPLAVFFRTGSLQGVGSCSLAFQLEQAGGRLSWLTGSMTVSLTSESQEGAGVSSWAGLLPS